MIRIAAVKHYADVLGCPIFIKELCPNNPHMGFFKVLNQSFNPIRGQRFNVIVKKQKQFTACDRRTEV